ncbi:hypothetical protein L1987_60921 [Smallanthus sonchifolius]|uniref:Uncharacterized protein n=1 Tax=Smallanthus sonchifolius TaxID=185202 RepID=A0ACB9D9R4_9ASTR|nr:hypothetical protein L1987_60921 [Smallanthus sonchifolius]
MTELGNQINTQLNNSNQGMTVFAPTDNAFSGLKPGSLNSLSDQEKVGLIQFHVVNISTGVVDATVANTIYSDGSLAVYQVDKVLLPMRMFCPPAPAPAPVPEKKNKKSKAGDGDESPADEDGSASADASGGVDISHHNLGVLTEAMAFIAMFYL